MAFPVWEHACDDFRPNTVYKGRYCRVCGWRYSSHGEALEGVMATQRAATPEEREALKVLGMETGVAYMPVSRCETCRWWKDRSWAGEGGLGECRLAGRVFERQFSVGDGKLLTSPDFGCVQWEARRFSRVRWSG